MIIQKLHPITGQLNQLDLPITDRQLATWKAGAYVQDAFPQLSADEREFLISGLLPGEYDAIYTEEDYR